jgi:RloB-like protein
MARRINIDRNDNSRKWKNGGIRPTNNRSGIKYFLIVTEGVKTEPHYFESLKRAIPRHAVQHIDIKGAGDNTYRVVKLAKETREKSLRHYDEVWAVFDRDSFPAEHFNQAIQQAKSWGIETAWTNEAFELWYLLHFQFVQNGMSREQYRPFLERELTQRMGQPFTYQKNRADMYDLLQQYGDEKRAIEWAKQLESHFEGETDYANQNPCTKVHVLINALNLLR